MHRATNWLLALGAALGAGCISLGPTPGLTFSSAVPASRAGAEISASIVPGYMLSSAVTQPSATQPKYGQPMLQLSLLLDPANLLGDTGLSGGFRVLSASDGYVEPQLRWRHSFLDRDQLSVGTSLSGTYVSYRDPDRPPLAYRAGRGTLEAGAEFRVTPPWWVELRLMGGGSATALSAAGTWCVGPSTGNAIECPTDGTPVLEVSGPAMGIFWSGYGGIAADFLRPQNSFFHFARLAGVVAAGTMPTMVPTTPQAITQTTELPADQGPGATWAYWGASVTVAFGAPGEAPRPAPAAAPAPPPGPVTPASAAAAPAPPPPEPDPDPANVRGQVRGSSGSPLAGATVRVVEAHVTERTDERGNFQLHVPAGHYTVRFEAEGQVAQTKTVAVAAGEQALFFVDLAPAAP